MSTGDIVGFVVVPLAIFLLTAAASGVVALVKLTSYFTASKAAQESTAISNDKIVKRLDVYCGQTDQKLNEYGERISVLEFAIKPAAGRQRYEAHSQ
jgi:hypothetical protein